MGLYRDEDNWAVVSYGPFVASPLPKPDYDEFGYKPDFRKLPTKSEYEAKQQNADRI